jgi:hypothetical protein
MKDTLKYDEYKQGVKKCRTCMYIDEYSLNVNDENEAPLGYDGTAVCCKHDDTQKENYQSNRLFISPCDNACPKYKRCTEKQAEYLEIYDKKTDSIIKNLYVCSEG